MQIPTFKGLQEEEEEDSQNATRYLRGLSQTNRLMMSKFRGKEPVVLPQLQKGEVSYIKLKQIQYRNRIRIKSEEPSHQENLRSDVEKNVYGEENIRNAMNSNVSLPAIASP